MTTGTKVSELGERLRRERHARHISVQELAQRLDVSESLIYHIETGRVRGSVRTLCGIVSELGLSLDALLGLEVLEAARADVRPAADPERSAAPRRLKPSRPPDEKRVQRRRNRQVFMLASGVQAARLTKTFDADVDFLCVVYEVGGSSTPPNGLTRHAGREYGVVLTGSLMVTVGSHTYEMHSGDSISYDSMVPHRIWNAGNERAGCIWIVVGRLAHTS